jgi:hypothetical protein
MTCMVLVYMARGVLKCAISGQTEEAKDEYDDATAYINNECMCVSVCICKQVCGEYYLMLYAYVHALSRRLTLHRCAASDIARGSRGRYSMLVALLIGIANTSAEQSKCTPTVVCTVISSFKVMDPYRGRYASLPGDRRIIGDQVV